MGCLKNPTHAALKREANALDGPGKDRAAKIPSRSASKGNPESGPPAFEIEENNRTVSSDTHSHISDNATDAAKSPRLNRQKAPEQNHGPPIHDHVHTEGSFSAEARENSDPVAKYH